MSNLTNNVGGRRSWQKKEEEVDLTVAATTANGKQNDVARTTKICKPRKKNTGDNGTVRKGGPRFGRKISDPLNLWILNVGGGGGMRALLSTILVGNFKIKK